MRTAASAHRLVSTLDWYICAARIADEQGRSTRGDYPVGGYRRMTGLGGGGDGS